MTGSGYVAEAVADRAAGESSSRTRAFVAAIIIGVGAAVLGYRLLRSGSDDESGSEEPAEESS
jgi:hypothetical protein